MEDESNQPSFHFFSGLLENEPVGTGLDGNFLNEHKYFLQQMSSLCGKVLFLVDNHAKEYLYISENADYILGPLSYQKRNIHGEDVFTSDFFRVQHASSLKALIESAQEKLRQYFTKRELLALSYTIKFDTLTENGEMRSYLQRGKMLYDEKQGYLPVESGFWLNISHWQKNDMQYFYAKSGNTRIFLKCNPYKNTTAPIRLSKAQIKVLAALKQRNNIDEAAHLLNLSKHTLQTHCKHILNKTEFSSRNDLLNFVIEAGIV